MSEITKIKLNGQEHTIKDAAAHGDIQSLRAQLGQGENGSTVIGSGAAYGENSVAIGANAIAGAKGFYWDINLNKESKEGEIHLLLSDNEESSSTSNAISLYNTFLDGKWVEGDALAMVNGTRYVNKSKVVEVNLYERESLIDLVVDSLPFEGGRVEGSTLSYSIINLNKPDMGPISFNNNAVAIGSNNSALGGYATATGYKNIAAGDYSFTEGCYNTALGTTSHAEGYGTEAAGYAHSEGCYSNAAGSFSHAEGYGTISEGGYSHAEGGCHHSTETPIVITIGDEDYQIMGSYAKGGYSHAEGQRTFAYGGSSHAEGQKTQALGADSHAEGQLTVAEGKQSHAEGIRTKALGDYTHAEGSSTKANGDYSHAEGWDSQATGIGAHAEGGRTADDETSITINNRIRYGTLASGDLSHAEGCQTCAEGKSSHAEGSATTAVGHSSHAEGCYSMASGVGSHAEGNNLTQTVKLTGDANVTTYIYNSGSFIVGDYFIINTQPIQIIQVNTANKTIKLSSTLDSDNALNQKEYTKYRSNLASGSGAHAEGRGTLASGSGAHAEGQDTTASGQASHAEGASSVATGMYAHVEGGATQATGLRSHAEGHKAKATGKDSHAEGHETSAEGIASHAEGGRYEKDAATNIAADNKWTIDDESITGSRAQGDFSHAEGRQTYARGTSSHAEGYQTYAKGDYSHAEGERTVAAYYCQHVQGTYNALDNNDSPGNYAHIVGNGTSESNRSNAHTLDWNGNAWFAGNITFDGLLILKSTVYGEEDLTEKTGIPGQIYFKKVEN